MQLNYQLKQNAMIVGAVYRPGQEDVPLTKQKPADAVELSYKTVAKELGYKGLRYKDTATLMALMAVSRVYKEMQEEDISLRKHTAVIVSSNFNNIDTVVDVARQIEAEHVNATSAMALPNASSNSVAATISIVFQLKGMNLMLCNGETSGEDALVLAEQLLDSGRAKRVLVVGVEVNNSTVRDLFPSNGLRFHGAAAVLLERNTKKVKEEALYASAQDVVALCGDASGATGVLRLLLSAEACLI